METLTLLLHYFHVSVVYIYQNFEKRNSINGFLEEENDDIRILDIEFENISVIQMQKSKSTA